MPEPVPTSGNSALEALLKGNDPAKVMDAIMGFTPSGAVVARAPDGRILRCSDYAARLLGHPRAELEGRLLTEAGAIIRPHDASGEPLPVEQLPVARALRGETVNAFEFSVETADGRRVPLIANAAPMHDTQGALIGAISSVTEFHFATEYKLYEALEQLLRGTDFIHETHSLAKVVAASMQAVLAKTNDAVITLDGSDRIVLFTPAAEQMFGVPAAEVLGGTVSRLMPERYRQAHDRFIRDFRTDGGDAIRHMDHGVSGLRAAGEEFPIEAWISRVPIGDEVFLTTVLQDVSERALIQDARLKTLLAREIEHRAQNALGAVQALVRMTTAGSQEELKRALQGRIAAYARGFSLLMQGAWEGVDLHELVEAELGAAAAPAQMRVTGPSVRITPVGVQALSLVLHELTTNALKYGALSREGGVVEVCWEIGPGPMLEMRWRETGGPALSEPPSRQGFGSVLLREVLVKQFKGRLTFDWRPEGLTATLTAPPPLFDEKSCSSDGPAGSEHG